MPPIRTLAVAKPVMAERTHEENQERAYIAASRRSDRTLGARIQSARRASEVHKRRTGRSLRITEQDVTNEEMYEEEYDNLPMQYRRLTTHLQTGSADFNRRHAAYWTALVDTRGAYGQATARSYTQQYPNDPQFASPRFVDPQFLSQPQCPQMLPAYSTSTLQCQTATTQTSPTVSCSPSAQDVKQEPTPHAHLKQYFTHPSRSRKQDTAQPQRMAQMRQVPYQITQSSYLYAAQTPPAYDPPAQALSSSIFTTSLPMESQQFLNRGFDRNEHFASRFSHDNDRIHKQPLYRYNPNGVSSKSRRDSFTSEGINPMFALSQLYTNPSSENFPYGGPTSMTTEGHITPLTHSLGYDFDALRNDTCKTPILTRSNSTQSSGGVTPGAPEWTALHDDAAYKQ
ncbi:hypothetical protein B0A49_08439 [Cryomyces minteri]|uniref:Uncharacterized protein n=1 Tax=Cryomyces minteri TaxID=331657 RepID=A0A4U0XA14_9PEZI|nr:hypothetical protein B0A49_08439 [Cryomyces minteri]